MSDHHNQCHESIVDQIRAEARKMTTLGQAFDMLRVAAEIERLNDHIEKLVIAGDEMWATLKSIMENDRVTEQEIRVNAREWERAKETKEADRG